jgi:hypothetical protein
MKLLKTCSFLILTTVIWLPSLSADAAGDGFFEVLVDDSLRYWKYISR